MIKPKEKILVIFYSIVFLGLFLYSFTQVDLNLTLVPKGFLQGIQNSLTYIGYFNRPFSTAIFLTIITALSVLYLFSIWLIKKRQLTLKTLSLILGIAVIILVFSYPAFSYDIYNYMFDAKIVLVYGESPYAVKPLDFPSDPWIRFMHWTHRPSIYPPVWIGLTFAPYLLGFNKFILILLNFKILMALTFLGSAYLVYKIASQMKVKNPILPVALFVLNPVMLIENLVSSHNDIVMMFFAILGIYFLIKRKSGFALLSVMTSALIKYTSVVLIPLVLYKMIQDRMGKTTDKRRIIQAATILMFVGLLGVVTKTEIQPWYLVWLLPFLVLLENDFLIPIIIGSTLGLLLRYTPYIYLGNWDAPVPQIKFQLTILALICIIPFELYLLFKRRKHATKKST